MMKTATSIVGLLLASSTVDAFAPPSSSSRTAPSSTTTTPTALNLAHIDTRHRIESQELGIWPTSCRNDQGNYVPCDALSGHDVRATWESYAPEHGSATSYGAIGCPGGGDWCYASSYGAAKAIPGSYDAKKKAATVAAALAGLGSGVGGATQDVGLSIQAGGASTASPPARALPSSSTSKGSMMGEDVREARMSYAPYSVHEGRVGTLGEIGAGSGLQPVQSVKPPAKKSSGYGIGSWKK